MKHKTVVYAFPTSHKFRVPFHELLRKQLAEHNVNYRYVYSKTDNLGKGDTEELPWAISVPVSKLTNKLVYQHACGICRAADLVILQQQNNLLLNYQVLWNRRTNPQRVAFMGHGKNFQSSNPDGLNERFKRSWSTSADWWFAYTERCARTVEGFGFPADRITVFNNAIDVAKLKADRAVVTSQEILSMRGWMFRGSRNIGLYVGGLYAEKRIDFLLEAAERIREKVLDFHLIVIGDGPEAAKVKAAANRMPWIHFLGPKFGRVKALYAAVARVIMMPGLVGLAVLDSFAYRIPMVTTDYPYHSPEIDYLKHDENGLMVRPYADVGAYSTAVVRLLLNPDMYRRLAKGAQSSQNDHTIEKMATRFTAGVLQALDAPLLPAGRR